MPVYYYISLALCILCTEKLVVYRIKSTLHTYIMFQVYRPYFAYVEEVAEVNKIVMHCHRDFGPGDFGLAGPKSPEITAGSLVRETKITRDIGPAPDILVRVADLRLCSR